MPYNDGRWETAELERVFYILLILFYIALPVSLILLRCITIKNVPKRDIFFLFNAFTAWFWIIWFFIIWSENWFRLDAAIFACMVGGPVMSFILAIVIEPIHAWSFNYGCTDADQPLPIQFDPTYEEEFRDIIKQIQDTGPTLTGGVVVERDSFTIKGNRTSFWELGGWEQFEYKSWVNLRQPHPYFHQDELEAGECRIGDCRHNFSDLDEVFSHTGPLVIKTTLDVVPANDATEEKYKTWFLDTVTQMAVGRPFIEEMVTVERLADEHCPNQLIPSLQLPSLVTTQTRDLRYGGMLMMEARDRLVCWEQPWWLNKCVYVIFSCLLLSSLYRVYYWIVVRVVKLHFRKSFNTEKNSTYSANEQFEDSHAIQPFKNHVQNFVTRPFS